MTVLRGLHKAIILAKPLKALVVQHHALLILHTSNSLTVTYLMVRVIWKWQLFLTEAESDRHSQLEHLQELTGKLAKNADPQDPVKLIPQV